MIDVEVRLFGAFRSYGPPSALVSLAVPESATVSTLKKALAAALRGLNPGFQDERLIEDSAIADERSVLAADAVIRKPCRLAILPPVCGG